MVVYYNNIFRLLNIFEFKVRTFNRNRCSIVYSCDPTDLVVLRTDSYAIDFSCKCSNCLKLSTHLLSSCKALKVLGFIMKSTKKWSVGNSMKTL